VGNAVKTTAAKQSKLAALQASVPSDAGQVVTVRGVDIEFMHMLDWPVDILDVLEAKRYGEFILECVSPGSAAALASLGRLSIRDAYMVIDQLDIDQLTAGLTPGE
jgi:hypothetical protein